MKPPSIISTRLLSEVGRIQDILPWLFWAMSSPV